MPYTDDANVVGRHCLSSPHCACMHVRMPMGEGCQASQLVHPYPCDTQLPLFRRGLRYGRAFVGRGDPTEAESVWDRIVIPQIERTISTAVLLARAEEPLEQHRRLLAAGARYRRALMLSPDFIVDNSGKVTLDYPQRHDGSVCAVLSWLASCGSSLGIGHVWGRGALTSRVSCTCCGSVERRVHRRHMLT